MIYLRKINGTKFTNIDSRFQLNFKVRDENLLLGPLLQFKVPSSCRNLFMITSKIITIAINTMMRSISILISLMLMYNMPWPISYNENSQIREKHLQWFLLNVCMRSEDYNVMIYFYLYIQHWIIKPRWKCSITT